MIGSLAVVPLPDGPFQPLQDALLNRYRIEVPIIPFPAAPQRLVRVSTQIYNQAEQYQSLAQALLTLLGEETASNPLS